MGSSQDGQLVQCNYISTPYHHLLSRDMDREIACDCSVNRERKRDLLESLAQTMNIELEQVIAIGDGANDLDMIDAAGLGIAFCAKPNVQLTVNDKTFPGGSTINVLRLDLALYFLGIRPKDLPGYTPHSKPRGLRQGEGSQWYSHGDDITDDTPTTFPLKID